VAPGESGLVGSPMARRGGRMGSLPLSLELGSTPSLHTAEAPQTLPPVSEQSRIFALEGSVGELRYPRIGIGIASPTSPRHHSRSTIGASLYSRRPR
jgi:hypothetical protein